MADELLSQATARRLWTRHGDADDGHFKRNAWHLSSIIPGKESALSHSNACGFGRCVVSVEVSSSIAAKVKLDGEGTPLQLSTTPLGKVHFSEPEPRDAALSCAPTDCGHDRAPARVCWKRLQILFQDFDGRFDGLKAWRALCHKALRLLHAIHASARGERRLQRAC